MLADRQHVYSVSCWTDGGCEPPHHATTRGAGIGLMRPRQWAGYDQKRSTMDATTRTPGCRQPVRW